MPIIKNITGREILDSRGNPTVEVDLTLDDDSFGRASVPSGASTGSHEAVELRDGGKRYNGKGVEKAVINVNSKLRSALLGKQFSQRSLDETMIKLDGTENKSFFGANAMLGISLAFAHASAKSEEIKLYEYFAKISNCNKITLPVPMMNILNGGKHAENSTDLQEFMIMPLGAPTFKEALRYGAETFYALKQILTEKGLSTTVGDEGGFAPSLPTNERAIELILEAIEKAGYIPGRDISIAIDCAATEIYQNNHYILKTEHRKLSSKEMIDLYEKWIDQYPIVSIEDGLAEDDWTGYEEFTQRLGSKIQIIGDDLFVTNVKRLDEGIKRKAANSILIKLNQIGTVTETIDVIELAKSAKYTSVISHRSGETEDTTIADFAVGVGAGQIKTGSICRSERVCKYNQLLRIEEELNVNAEYLGAEVLKK